MLGSFFSTSNDLITRADAARDRKDWTTSAKLYRQALDAKPTQPAIWIQLGHALKASGDLSGAECAYRTAIDLAPEDSDAHLQLGHALKLLGRRDLAADSYTRAVALDSNNKHARGELIALGFSRSAISNLSREGMGAKRRPETSTNQIAFDVSDLMHYFLRARTPTGIQPVQMNVVTELLNQPPSDIGVLVVCFTQEGDFWVEVRPETFANICFLARASGEVNDPIWRNAIEDLRSALATGDSVEFARGTCLVNLGTSWWLKDYFLKLRYAKSKFELRYIPFVHDCIPIKAPEHCVKDLTQDFIAWILGVLVHADGYIVNSNATKSDIVETARTLGYDISTPKVVYLDRPLTIGDSVSSQGAETAQGFLMANGLDHGEFVLFVSTIESRKNHRLAFDAWLKLIKKRGLAATPRLVCVGSAGWLVDAAMARLGSSDLLKQKVTILSKVSDVILAELYRRCAFTIYPSCYEGWGLPVTEAFGYGKACLTANTSSLPEAGGDFADYFDVESERDFLAKLERLIDDRPYRAQREAKIAADFKPRAWGAIARDIVASAFALLPETRVESGVPFAANAAPGLLHVLSRNVETRIWPGMSSGEIYRGGLGWNFCDDWGCWAKDSDSELIFRVPLEYAESATEYFFYIGLKGLPVGTVDAKLEIRTAPSTPHLLLSLPAGSVVFRKLVLKASDNHDRTIRVTVRSDARVPLQYVTGDVDKRAATVGIIGFFYCKSDDEKARINLLEAMHLNYMSLVMQNAPHV